MSEAATVAVQRDETPRAEEALRGRTRTCVGCGERVEVLDPANADFVRLILGPGGEIAVDPKGGGFGRGAHVHARRGCLERAVRVGLPRVTKGKAHVVFDLEGESDKSEALSTDSLARAIQRSMDRRIEGLLRAAVRSRHVARGADAVTGACRRDEAELVLVACDAAAAADLTEVRRAVAEGRAVAWGTKERLGAIVAPVAVRSRLGSPSQVPGPEGVGVVAIASRRIAGALRQAVQTANAVTSVDPAQGRAPAPEGTRARSRGERGSAGPRGAKRARDRSDG
jgi:predicted RNA-binding protein YlxR (DUF448 family)/ribosomal protein L7Ae-like RNA K-turn-binding protein